MKILKLITFVLVILCCNSCSKDEEEFNVIDGGQIVEVPQSGGNYLLKSSQYSQWWLVKYQHEGWRWRYNQSIR